MADFHQNNAKWRLLVGSNRSGKTLAAAIEFARAVLGRDPYQKYRPKDGMALVIGLDADHLGMLWRKLTTPGAFTVIKDQKRLRALRYDETNPTKLHPEDAANTHLWQDAPPIIPAHMLQGKPAWYHKARHIPRLITFQSGWRALFLTSQGVIKQGEHYDLVWIDEQIQDEQFFWEAVRGLVDVDPRYKSRGIWSATSQRQNPLLWELAQKACTSDEIAHYTLRIADNPFITEQDRQLFTDMLPEEERLVRIDGVFALEAWRIYPEFDPHGAHGCEPFPIPEDWTHIMAVDPGVMNCATVFGAIGPDDKTLYIYDELLLHNVDAHTWAAHIAQRPDASLFDYWIIDSRAGRSRGIGNSIQIAAHFFQALTAHNIAPLVTGPLAGWIPGSDNPEVRKDLLRRMFRASSMPDSPDMGIKIFRGRCPKLIQQLRIAQYDAKNPKRRITGEFDLLDALEYLVAFQPHYVPKPPPASSYTTTLMEIYRQHHHAHGPQKQWSFIAYG
ncbi:MAG: hypothetical protein NZ821_05970 [Gloeomargarita sp. SKYB31]|nr:hypothetical protein [Gloeomargarita sp. SKYB31]